MKNISLLSKKLRLFYEDIEKKTKKNPGRMCLQTDLEFKQNQFSNLMMNLM